MKKTKIKYTEIQRFRRNEPRRTYASTTLNPENRTLLRVEYSKGTKKNLRKIKIL